MPLTSKRKNPYLLQNLQNCPNLNCSKMRKSSAFVIALFFIVSLSSPTAGYEIDLYQPFNGLKTRLDKIDGPLNVTGLIGGLVKALGCLTPPPANETLLFAESDFLTFRNTDEMRLPFPENLTERLKEYVKLPEFEEMHNFLWAELHWNDMIRFYYRYGFNGTYAPNPDIYTWIIGVYTDLGAPSHLIDGLPTGPPTLSQMTGYKTRSIPHPLPPSSIPWSLVSIFQEQQGCTEEDWLKIIQQIVESQGLQWLDLLRFVIREQNSNPSVHAAFAKISEAEKGRTFRDFRQINAMIKLIDHWDTQLKNNELFQLIIGILESLTGINFDEMNINVVGNIISILEWLVWGTPFPRPTMN